MGLHRAQYAARAPGRRVAGRLEPRGDRCYKRSNGTHTLMTLTHILVDYENTQPGAQDVALVKGRDQRLWIFRGAGQKKYPGDFTDALLALQGRATGIACARSGRNALDMHIVLHLGRLLGAAEAGADGAPPGCVFFIVSRDKDYEPVLEYLRAQGLDARRVTSVREALGQSDEPKAGRGRTSTGAAPTRAPRGARAAKAGNAGNAARVDDAGQQADTAKQGNARRRRGATKAAGAANTDAATKAGNANRASNTGRASNAAKSRNLAKAANAAQAPKSAKASNTARSGNASKASKAAKTAKAAPAPVAAKRSRTTRAAASAPAQAALPSADAIAQAAAVYLEARTKNRPTSRNKLERWIGSHYRTKLGDDVGVDAVVAALARRGVVAFDGNKVAYPQWS